jgi:Fur family zinc uptake transcriptional regulator
MADSTQGPDHTHEPVAQALAEAERVCARKNVKLTSLRRRAIEALALAGKPVKAYDLLPALGRDGEPAKPASAYRTLEVLEDLGLVHRVAGINAFVLCAHGGGAHATSLFICDTCGRTLETRGPTRDAAPAGFAVSRSVIEHYGLCADCAG